jgi:hypothetical protein
VFLELAVTVRERSPRFSVDAVAESLGVAVIAHVGLGVVLVFEWLARNDRHGSGQFLFFELVGVTVDDEERVYHSKSINQSDFV